MGRGIGNAAAMIPTLTTERCVLRAFRESDVPALAALHGDPDVVRFLGVTGEPDAKLSNAWDYVAMHLGHWVLKGYGKWALAERDSDKLIGRVGFWDSPHDWPGLELGWTIAREIWGKGYATEAARSALRWGFENIAQDEIISLIHEGNARSIRVAERLGEKLLRKGTPQNEKHLIYGISREEWRASGQSQ